MLKYPPLAWMHARKHLPHSTSWRRWTEASGHLAWLE